MNLRDDIECVPLAKKLGYEVYQHKSGLPKQVFNEYDPEPSNELTFEYKLDVGTFYVWSVHNGWRTAILLGGQFTKKSTPEKSLTVCLESVNDLLKSDVK
ncbi:MULTISPECIES: hypothetical protein [Vibrio]|uniref:hypothetical protein n=1 Tax=Vibrio TaxID=662 RepID=UPI0008416F48|nr:MULTISPECIES: hypothetical protein [Vibrio]ODM56026.1 hypothetical protein BC455_22780 [Vibrio harveyi]USD58591.1 hypothetical protein J4N44_26940 [Vibrio sp. SCSIO 43155]